MTTGRQDRVRCTVCETEYPAGTQVCPACKTILITPGARNSSPLWVIIVLLLVIVVLFIVACMQAYQTFVLHQY
jgi:hypothetical protein